MKMSSKAVWKVGKFLRKNKSLVVFTVNAGHVSPGKQL